MNSVIAELSNCYRMNSCKVNSRVKIALKVMERMSFKSGRSKEVYQELARSCFYFADAFIEESENHE